MYHVISTGIAIAILYLICNFFYKAGFISQSDHRKIWNTILVVTFLMTALAGLTLALKITYKWQSPFFTELLKWHVETGIAFSFTGIIHLLWHLPYYLDFFRKVERSCPDIKHDTDRASKKYYSLNLFLIGYLSASLQLLFLREVLNLAGGYELIAGTYLAAWLINSAFGSWFAGKTSMNNLNKINIIFAVSPLISLLLMILSSKFFLNQGETPSFLVSILFTIFILFPFCFLSGYIFIKVLIKAKDSGTLDSGRSFSVETVGGIAAGLIVTVLTSGFLNTYQTLLISVLLYFLYIAIVHLNLNHRFSQFVVISGVGLILVIIGTDPDRYFRQLFLQGIRVDKSKDTPYGNITYGTYHDERSIFYNHRTVRWENDETEREENIHYTMAQHNNPGSVLMISGDLLSTIPEITKYGVKKIYYVERDPEFLKSFLSSEIPGKEIVITENTDAYRFVKKTSEKFDLVIMVLPPPSTLLLNRYYTKEFFEEVKNKLNDNGIFTCTPGSAENYYNYQSASLYSIIYKTLSSVFRNVLPVAGNKLYFISSDANLSTEICALIENKNIDNIYVNSRYLDDELIKIKSDEIILLLDKNARINTLRRPLAYFHYQFYNLSRDPGKAVPALIVVCLFFVLPFVTVRKRNFPMYSAAATLAGYEIMTLAGIQSSAGSIYHLTGLVFAAVMVGLAAGAWTGVMFRGKNVPALTMSALLIFYISAGLLFGRIIVLDNSSVVVFILITLSLIPAFFTGSLFRVLSVHTEDKISTAGVYSSDLAGSALGFIIISAISLPLAGTDGTFIILSAITITGLIFAFKFSKH